MPGIHYLASPAYLADPGPVRNLVKKTKNYIQGHLLTTCKYTKLKRIQTGNCDEHNKNTFKSRNVIIQLTMDGFNHLKVFSFILESNFERMVKLEAKLLYFPIFIFYQGIKQKGLKQHFIKQLMEINDSL